MAIWKERRSLGSHSIPCGDYRALVRQTGPPNDPVEITYLRYLPGNPSPLGWRPNPDDTAVARVEGAEHAPNLREGKLLARETLEKLVGGQIVANESGYQLPIQATRSGEVSHSTKMIVAVVQKWPSFYEVRTIGFVPDGYTLPVGTPAVSPYPGHDWGRLDLFDRLLADTEEEAMEAAGIELDRLAASDIPAMLWSEFKEVYGDAGTTEPSSPITG